MTWMITTTLLALVLAALVLAAVASVAGTALVLRQARRQAILAHPNERSSHSVPTPHGGGLAVVAVILSGWLALALGFPGTSPNILIIIACCLPLAAISRHDDLHGLAPQWRLLAQGLVAAVALGLTAPAGPGFSGLYFQGLVPGWLDPVLAGILWVWFINLFNFMDGIDGMAGSETAAIGIGLALIAVVTGMADGAVLRAAVITGAAIGFLWWNCHPAKIFLGDVGSVPLGFLLGWLLLDLAARGQWAAALILPLYYLADATVTLIRRAIRGEPVWRAHRQHFYQLAVHRGRSHGAVVGAVTLANTALIALALTAVLGWPLPALGGGIVVVLILLRHLAHQPPTDATAA